MLHILANGALAYALALGLNDKFKLCVVGRDLANLDKFKQINCEIISFDELYSQGIDGKKLILCFKPYALNEVSLKLKGEAKFVISPLANTDFNALHSIKAKNYAMIMPNIAAKFKASITPFVLENTEFKDEIVEILQSFGKAVRLDNATQMNAAMALSGCGPAFLSIIAEALMNGGVYEGLPKNLSKELTSGLFTSFAALLNETHPALIKEAVCSPGGTSIKGVAQLEKHGIRGAFFDALSASAKKT